MILYLNQRNEVTLESETNGQTFSGTDLNKNPDKDTGIVFPLANPNNQVSVSSIIDHRNGKVRLAHCEARIANQEGDNTVYRKGLAIAVVLDDPNLYPPIPVSQQLFGVKSPVKDYVVTSSKDINIASLNANKNLSVIIESFRSLDYKADTSFIFSHNVEKKPIAISYYNPFKGKQQIFDYADDVEIEVELPEKLDKEVSRFQKIQELNTFFKNVDYDIQLTTIEAFKKRNQKAREAYFRDISLLAKEFDFDIEKSEIFYKAKDYVKAYELAIDEIYRGVTEWDM